MAPTQEVGTGEFDVAGLRGPKIAAAEPGQPRLQRQERRPRRARAQRRLRASRTSARRRRGLGSAVNLRGRAEVLELEPWRELAQACGAEPDRL